MEISSNHVKELRERTGAGMMDCKKALAETAGDFEKAIEWLRKKGLSAAGKKAGRVAAEGAVSTFVSADGKTGVLLEINSETDFVAKNDKFQALVKGIVQHIATNKPANMDALVAQKFNANQTVKDVITEAVATIGENIVLRRFETFDLGNKTGLVVGYLHGEGRIGVLVEVEGATAAATSFAKDVAMHVAAMNPLCVRGEELASDLVAKERDVLKAKALESGKKADMIDKIVEGQINKWKSEVCLLNQKFVKNPDISVADLQKQTGTSLGLTLNVKRFVRFELGEGIEKKKDNFAEEVAAQLKG